MRERSVSRRREYALRAVLVAGSLAASALIVEGALRIYLPYVESGPRQSAPALALLQENPHGTGSYRLRPNLSVQVRVGWKTIRVTTNHHGMRWREVPVAKPAGVRRVAFLGDSFAFGCWSDSIESSLIGVFERTVGGRWEALNFGVGGYGPLDQELQLEEEVVRFAPDAVIIVFFAGNDFRDAGLGARRNVLVDGKARLLDAVLREQVPEEERVLDSTRAEPLPSARPLRWVEGLALFRLARPLLDLKPARLRFRVNHNFTTYTYWSQHPYPAVALQARDQAIAAYERIRAALDERGIPLGIVAMPYKEQVYVVPFADEDYDLDLPQAYVQIYARERHVPFLELLHPFRSHAEAGGGPLFWDKDTHLNDAGHRLAGEETAIWFRRWWRGRRNDH